MAASPKRNADCYDSPILKLVRYNFMTNTLTFNSLYRLRGEQHDV